MARIISKINSLYTNGQLRLHIHTRAHGYTHISPAMLHAVLTEHAMLRLTSRRVASTAAAPARRATAAVTHQVSSPPSTLRWTMVGCDSDAGGALAVVRGDSPGAVSSVEVVDAPTMKVNVNGKPRVRLCVEAMAAALDVLALPPRTVVYLEEGGVEFGFGAQTAFIQGYNFGLWRGLLAARGLKVEVVKPQAWKAAMGLAHKDSSKDASRTMARAMFPEVAAKLARKKDHGRAEALLIAAYGHVAAASRVYAHNGHSDGGTGASTTLSETSTSTSVHTPASTSTDGVPKVDELCARVRAHLELNGAALNGDDGPLPYFGPYFGMAGGELQAELRTRKLKISGKKMELVARLEADDRLRMTVHTHSASS